MDNFGFRYFDWELGRFITRDPAGQVDGPNVYLYCRNNPINHIDPLGLYLGNWLTKQTAKATRAVSSWAAEKIADTDLPGSQAVSQTVGAVGEFNASMQEMVGSMDPIKRTGDEIAHTVSTVSEKGFVEGGKQLAGEKYEGLKESVGTNDFVRMADAEGKYSTGERIWYGVQGTAKTIVTVAGVVKTGRALNGGKPLGGGKGSGNAPAPKTKVAEVKKTTPSTAGGKKPIVIGQDMKNRVIPKAKELGADYIAPI